MKSAHTPGGLITCSPPCEPTSASGIYRHAWEKTASAIPGSQLRTLLEVVLPLHTLTMPHTDILAVLAARIQEKKFRRLRARRLKAGVQRPGGVGQDELGSPQGSIVSPVIAHVCLDTVLDQGVATMVKSHCRGDSACMRYAADTLLVFAREDDAR